MSVDRANTHGDEDYGSKNHETHGTVTCSAQVENPERQPARAIFTSGSEYPSITSPHASPKLKLETLYNNQVLPLTRYFVL